MSPDAQVGGGRLLVGDGILAFLLLNEGRHRIVARVFGVLSEDSNLVALFAIAAVAEMLRDTAPPIPRPARPSVGDTALGAGALNATAHGIAGGSSWTAPLFGALMAFAVLARSFRPVARASLRGLRGSSRVVAAGAHSVRTLLEGERDVDSAAR